jgi:hypothetical protein
MMAMALDKRVKARLTDGDRTIEEHNLARQLLLVGHLNEGAKAPVVAAELARLDKAGEYHGRVAFVEKPEDVEPLDVDALLCLPDNDEVRAVTAQAAWEWGVLYAQAGTGARGGQFTIQEPGRACLGCLAGITRSPVTLPQPRSSTSGCMHAPDSVVGSNFVVPGLMLSELREALAGRKSENLQFHAAGGGGNRITWMIGDPECEHRTQAGCKARRTVGASMA